LRNESIELRAAYRAWDYEISLVAMPTSLRDFPERRSRVSITHKWEAVIQAEGLLQASPGQSEPASARPGFSDPRRDSPNGAKQ